MEEDDEKNIILGKKRKIILWKIRWRIMILKIIKMILILYIIEIMINKYIYFLFILLDLIMFNEYC